MVDDKKYYMYVVKCCDNTFYTGYTTDVNRRIIEHNTSEKGAKYTKYRRPVQLVFYQDYETKQLAMKAEARFKKLSRKAKEQIIYGEYTKKF